MVNVFAARRSGAAHFVITLSCAPARAGAAIFRDDGCLEIVLTRFGFFLALLTPMRDIFEPIASDPPPDPTEASRRNMRALRRRFYTTAEVREVAAGFEVALDDRPIRTPARHPLVFPTRGLAEAAAAEWNAQGELIEPGQMPLTRLANTIIDGVAAATDAVAAEVAKYLGSDLLFYRASGPERLVALQRQFWDPVLEWARDALGARFLTGTGVMPLMQPEQALTAARAAIPHEPWRLGAVHAVTTLTGSALLALALYRGAVTSEVAWTAANVDEDWNIEQWGADALALERRALRSAEMEAAARVLAQVGAG
jgi:chaperone required for assembly of F1-ATPase